MWNDHSVCRHVKQVIHKDSWDSLEPFAMLTLGSDYFVEITEYNGNSKHKTVMEGFDEWNLDRGKEECIPGETAWAEGCKGRR